MSTSGARRDLKSTVEQLQETLRGACIALNSPAAGEALASAEKLTDTILQGIRALRAGREGGELTEEQRKSLENLAKQLRLDELGALLSQFAQSGLEQALREYDKALQLKQPFCMLGICIVPDQRERDEPRRNRGNDRDGFPLALIDRSASLPAPPRLAMAQRRALNSDQGAPYFASLA